MSDGPDWTFDLLDVYLAKIDRVAKLYRWIPTRTSSPVITQNR
ncbi:hypothetical protein ACNKHT_07685 [Shigella flexneri]